MNRLYSHRDRPVHLGPLPVERLARQADAPEQAGAQCPQDGPPSHPAAQALAQALQRSAGFCARFLQGATAPLSPAASSDPADWSRQFKAAAHFLDMTLAGVCVLQPGEVPGHTHALVFALEDAPEAHADEPGAEWVRGTQALRGDLRCTEVAVVLAGYFRALGRSAQGHVPVAPQAVATEAEAPEPPADPEALQQAEADEARLACWAQRAGLARADENGRLQMPLLRRGFRLGAVSTDAVLAVDAPLAPGASLDWPDSDAWLGVGGTRPGFAAADRAKRPLHAGAWPMETIPRVAQPTTLVLRDEIVRVPKRADLFTRALAGDLGERARLERQRFAVKHPLAWAMTPLIRGLVPLQGAREPVPEAQAAEGAARWDASDAARNTLAVKALAHHLGADFVGVCAAEPWMYYSHDEAEGKPIAAYHRWAVVMLIDQGFETMEGASGDDWISGAQSMRAYLRGALIAGVMADHLRRLGHSARAQTNAHSELLHIPAVLMAGLGELSRIGELVLNPFIGPRSKSVLLTTDLPLVADQPIDFGVQAMCAACLKCARECPCNAIPFGPKVVFNGYEIWKPDVEKCGKYRLTNMKGSACGRCMKTCPYNREDLVQAGRWLTLAMSGPEARRHLIAHDDAEGGGQRNPVKRWWWDLEMVNGVAMAPVAGVNARDLQPGREDKLRAAQRLAFWPPALQPAGGTTVASTVPLDRAQGLAAAAAAESPAAARRRRRP